MDDLKKQTTKDGSLSLYSSNYEECFHDTEGALKESINKYLLPAQLDRFSNSKKIVVLDVCMGLGYNTGSILEELLKRNHKIEWHGLEIDQRPLNIGLNEKTFQKLWSPKVLRFFDCLKKSERWIEGLNKGTIHWGDARQKISEIQDSLMFDLILLDPFSPQKCPELWSEQFISLLSSRLSLNGRLITYSSAASIRASLKKAGLKIYSIIPSTDKQNKWSLGTVAMKQQLEQQFISKNCQIKNLSDRELEHLNTRSSIPYRDPTGRGNSKEIILSREIEQSKSQLINTSSWRKKWNAAQ
ncbi:MnmC family methyltransferase [Prochlorococcus marinus]|uniref:SAM-dependent methyltransferase n=1 Tax=Prochlorococcus marinus XMU1408 TaxID=2213228 RepID=A0A318R590_PROMR|nr:MnmC family methyltransferase [Prochlorococcus marinus]PYE02792.1 SAM-dependent methyltransferase [Prochlorococcus marinus XMU1408]